MVLPGYLGMVTDQENARYLTYGQERWTEGSTLTTDFTYTDQRVEPYKDDHLLYPCIRGKSVWCFHK
jgi:hypothetical protein